MERREVEDALKSVIDPETGKNIIDSGMVKKIEIDGKKVKILLKPLSTACAMCWVMTSLIAEMEEKLSEKGYNVEVDIEL